MLNLLITISNSNTLQHNAEKTIITSSTSRLLHSNYNNNNNNSNSSEERSFSIIIFTRVYISKNTVAAALVAALVKDTVAAIRRVAVLIQLKQQLSLNHLLWHLPCESEINQL